MERYKKYLTLGVCLLGLLSLLRTVILLWNSNFIDFSQLYKSTQTLFLGIDPYIVIENGMTANYLPIIYLILFPLTLTSITVAGNIFLVISLMATILSIVMLKKIFKLTTWELLIISTLLVVSFPFKFNLGMGQVNLILLLFLSLFLFYYPRRSSVFAHLSATLLKIFPIVFTIIPLIQRRWMYLFYQVAFIVLIMFISVITFGVTINISYFKNSLLFLLFQESFGSGYYNQSITGALSRLGTSELLIQVIRGIIVVITTYLIYKNKTNTIYIFSLLLTVVLLINTFTWQHYLVLSIIPFLYLYKTVNQMHERLLLVLAYIFIAVNVQNPGNLSASLIGNVILNHGFWSLCLLFSLLIHSSWKKKNNG